MPIYLQNWGNKWICDLYKGLTVSEKKLIVEMVENGGYIERKALLKSPYKATAYTMRSINQLIHKNLIYSDGVHLRLTEHCDELLGACNMTRGCGNK